MSELRHQTLPFPKVKVGDELPPLEIPLTPTVIVSTAIASRDYQDVHHDVELAKKRGSKNIFMNILSTNGFVGRFVTDWAGADARITAVSIKLGTPNLPGDTMTITGEVKSKQDDGTIEIEVAGKNSWGNHFTGTVTVVLPTGA